MEDPILNRNLDEIKELQTRWNQFHDFYNMAVQQGLANVTAQAEMKFLELKSRIAMLHDGFMGGVKGDVKTAQNIIQIVADCIQLKKVAQATDAERQKFEFDWNECFMLLNETVSTMEEEKKRLAGINERAYKAAQRREIMKARIHNFLHSPLLKWCVIIGGTVGVLVAGQVFYDYRNLYMHPPLGMNFTKSMYKGFVGTLWRPLIMPDYEYNDYDEIDVNPTPEVVGAQRVDKPTVDAGRFLNSFLPTLGFSQADIDAVKPAFDKKLFFSVEQWNLNGNNTFIAILYPTSADAKQFADTANQAAGRSAKHQNILDTTHLVRRANLILIGNGPHPLHTGFINSKWYADKFKNELK